MKTQRYIPSRNTRIKNNLIKVLYVIAIIVMYMEFKYTISTYNKIISMNYELGSEANNQEIIITKKHTYYPIYMTDDAEIHIKKFNSDITADRHININPNITKEICNIDIKIDENLFKKIDEDESIEKENKDIDELSVDNINLVRCTGYCDDGYTASGEHVRDGIAAGKREWLGKTAILYSVTADNSIGEYIGTYEFKDTGNGIDTDGDGIGDSIKKGKSIDIWHDTREACFEWAGKYGDYVYMQLVD